MREWRVPSYKTFGIVYALILALVVTIVIQISASQGFVLGVSSILAGIVLIDRSFQATRQMLLVHTAVFILMELTACVVILVNHKSTDLWLASMYIIFAILLVGARILKKMPGHHS